MIGGLCASLPYFYFCVSYRLGHIESIEFKSYTVLSHVSLLYVSTIVSHVSLPLFWLGGKWPSLKYGNFINMPLKTNLRL